MNMIRSCIICGNKLPPPEADQETLGPLFCERHEVGELRARGVIGFPTLEMYAPIDPLSRAVEGRPIERAGAVEEPSAHVWSLVGGDLLLLFPSGHRTTFAQYVPAPSVAAHRGAVMEILEEIRGDESPELAGLAAAIRHQTPLRGMEYWVGEGGAVMPEVLTVRFYGGLLLDLECVGSSFYTEGPATEVSLQWRDGLTPDARRP